MRMAMERGQPPVIRGKVTSASYQVWEVGHLLYAQELICTKATLPYQVNDMQAWLQCIMKQEERNEGLLRAYKTFFGSVEYEVNGGGGRLIGRGSNRNIFTYTIKGVYSDGTKCWWKIDLLLITVLHQQLYNKKVKSGDHTPTPRAAPPVVWEAHQRRDGKIYHPVDLMGLGGEPNAWHTYDNWDEYYKEHPEMQGQAIPVRED